MVKGLGVAVCGSWSTLEVVGRFGFSVWGSGLRGVLTASC